MNKSFVFYCIVILNKYGYLFCGNYYLIPSTTFAELELDELFLNVDKSRFNCKLR